MSLADLDSARKGNSDAFARLVAPQESRLYQLALGVTGNREDAEDVWQSALLRAWKSLRSLKDPQALRQWMSRIVINEARRVLSKRGPEPTSGIVLEGFVPATEDLEIRRLSVLSCLRQIEPEQREVIVLRFWMDLPLDHIAGIVEAPLSTVKSRLYRGLESLKAYLREEDVANGPEST